MLSSIPTDSGFRTGDRGVHNTRTIMLADLRQLLDAYPPGTPRVDYQEAVVDENLLGKRTASTRKYTFQRLSELYAIDPDVPVFSLLRRYWEADEGDGHPLLAMLCALARDPILRMTAPPVLDLEPGGAFEKATLEKAIAEAAPDRFSPKSLAKIARMTGSSWTQSGHLDGRTRKYRTRPVVTPAAAAYALALGYLAGARGAGLFRTFWARVLDLSPEQLHGQAEEASRRALLTYRNAGSVVEVVFDVAWSDAELDAAHRAEAERSAALLASDG